ncbi:MAG: electron transfer flavoprotein subunit alpha [Oscillospiraceae bacterium]|nr:electron transfer flavoprotein subunit alpha [Oscillospiraceae bacterium]
MAELVIHPEQITPEGAKALVSLCPFGAIREKDGGIDIGQECKMCGLCVRKGPKGAVTLQEDAPEKTDLSDWKGVAVFCEQQEGEIHSVSRELLGKARELAAVTGEPVYALLMGSGVMTGAELLSRCGADKVFVYDAPELETFRIGPYTNAFSDFVRKVKPSCVLVGATNMGRSLAPRTAARFLTGVTADCTKLEMRPDGNLVQIRPAFGGNIMAQIVTTRTRPQFCTVRSKVFPLPKAGESAGEIKKMTLSPEELFSAVQVLEAAKKPKETDISEAEVIVACGRGFKKKDDLALAQSLADALGGQIACTRPIAEAGWLPQNRQIGLSGRTVAPKLIITLGISGSVQFAAGMKGSEFIVAVDENENAPIFDVAHYGIVGDLYQVVPELLRRIREGNYGV